MLPFLSVAFTFWVTVDQLLLACLYAACHSAPSLPAGAAPGADLSLPGVSSQPWMFQPPCWLDLIRARSDETAVGTSGAVLCRCSQLVLLLLAAGAYARALVGGLKQNTMVVVKLTGPI